MHLLSQIAFKVKYTILGCLQNTSRISEAYRVTSSCLSLRIIIQKSFLWIANFVLLFLGKKLIWLQLVNIYCYYHILWGAILVNMPRRDKAQSYCCIHFVRKECSWHCSCHKMSNVKLWCIWQWKYFPIN